MPNLPSSTAGLSSGKSFKKFLKGSPAKYDQVSSLRPEQEGLYNQLNTAAQQGPGGAFGQAADYYRGLMGNESQDYNDFAAPALRQYREEIMPGIAEQYAGMGAGGLSSSGFQNAQIQGATDLSERLGALRANLRQQGAHGLQNIGMQGLQPYSQNAMTRQGSEGLLPQIQPLVGAGVGYFASGGNPAGAAAGYQVGNWLKGGAGGGTGNSVGANSGPYQGGNSMAASPQIDNPYAQQGTGGFQLPKFGQRGY